MNKLMIFAALFVLIFNSSCKDNLEGIKTKFGIEKNAERKSLHLVTVDPAFKIIEDESLEGRRFIFVNKHEPDIKDPEFLRKIIVLDSAKENISSEIDEYKNPIEDKHILVQHNYYNDLTSIDLQANHGESGSLDSHQADSILSAWKININPFR